MIHPIYQIDTDKCSPLAIKAMNDAVKLARKKRSELITPEHLLYAITCQDEFVDYTLAHKITYLSMQKEVLEYIEAIDKVPEDEKYTVFTSLQLKELMELVDTFCTEINQGVSGGNISRINPVDILVQMLNVEESFAGFIMEKYLNKKYPDWDNELSEFYLDDITSHLNRKAEAKTKQPSQPHIFAEAIVNGKRVDISGTDMYKKLLANAGQIMGAISIIGPTSGVPGAGAKPSAQPQQPQQHENDANQDPEKEEWEEMVTCLNDVYKQKNPLIGREKELNRAIRILCRKDKNNPLFIGEPGVGKTALIYGLVKLIEEGNVPKWLRNQRVYALDMAAIVAGTSFHGEFEKRMKDVLDGARHKGNCIIYIDEIHSIADAGGGNGSMNAADLMKPYLEDGSIRFIGTTTYKDFNKSLAKNKAIVRRFGQVDIKEPSVDETIKIITALLPLYEKYHGVRYDESAVRYVVEQSNALINDRYLPDKVIDIIDEAGAYLQQNPLLNKNGATKQARFQKVDKNLMKKILVDVCRIDAKALSSENNDALRDLDKRICSDIYGQDEAIKQVVRSVMMSKAGLMEPDKPIASLLFVGPTGVGKTEVCKVLARELGIELVRFDMSEYTEKHTISKLIGSPAGYIGYEEGGLLTDAVRKTPNCVLLLDEIEKAHTDIYNILLQVMDYAKLTDNKGNKADFRNVILVMTSNAGAQFAAQAGIGFGGGQSKGQAMLQTVKKTFKPEFLNRLSGTVVFNEMDKIMASLILDKKLRQLSERLAVKSVTMNLTPDAHEFLLTKGFTQQYGAREMDRVIQQYLTPLLMEEILFGKLRKGGTVNVTNSNETLTLA